MRNNRSWSKGKGPGRLLVVLGIAGLLAWAPLHAVEDALPAGPDTQQVILDTLTTLITLQAEMKRDIAELHRTLEQAQTAGEKRDIQSQLDKLEEDLVAITRNLKEIAAGADINSLRKVDEKQFSLQEELFSLLRPALEEMKDKISDLEISFRTDPTILGGVTVQVGDHVARRIDGDHVRRRHGLRPQRRRQPSPALRDGPWPQDRHPGTGL